MAKSKKEIRKEKLHIRKALTDNEIEYYSDMIMSRLVDMPEYRNCSNVLLYCSYNNEVDTKKLIEYSMKAGNIYLPKVNGDTMDFYKVIEWESLKPGCMGILEPDDKLCEKLDATSDLFVVIPMSAYDRQGNRIGYGSGYYDKFLAKCTDCIKVGVAYSLQECDEVPSEKTDIKLDYIVNENEIIEVKDD